MIRWLYAITARTLSSSNLGTFHPDNVNSLKVHVSVTIRLTKCSRFAHSKHSLDRASTAPCSQRSNEIDYTSLGMSIFDATASM